MQTSTPPPDAGSLPALVEQLGGLLGPQCVITDEAECRFMSMDIAGPGPATACCIVRPETAEGLAQAVAATTARGYSVVARGGGASYTGGFLPQRPATVLVDTRGLQRVVEIHAGDAYVTVEAGCTWQRLLEALRPHGLRTPFWGPLSGATATVGGSLSQHAILWGSARYGLSADSVVSLAVVLADGSTLHTGAAALGTARPFFRHYGPDLTGLFLGDSGALGIKVRATLRLIRQPAASGTASFAFADHVTMARAMAELAREGIASECFGMDPVLQAQRMKRASLAQDLKAVAGVVTAAGGLGRGLKEAARVALAGRGFLDATAYSLHVGVEGRSAVAIREELAEVSRIAGAHGGHEVENTIPKVLRGSPFVSMSSGIGPSGERWLPVHAIVPLSDAADAWSAVRRLLDEFAAEFATHGVQVGVLTAIVGGNAFVLEPVFYWPAPRTLYYERVLDRATLDRFTDFPPNPAAEALVREARSRLTVIFLERGAAHLQIGRTYRYREGLRPEAWRLVAALKRAVDAPGLVNPGALGLASHDG